MDREFFDSIIALLLHPDSEFQKQGLVFLESLQDEDIWNALMTGASIGPELSHSEYEMSAGLKQALLSNPFYQYADRTEFSISAPFPFDLGALPFKKLEKLELRFSAFHSYLQKRKNMAEEDLFFLQGLKSLPSVKHLCFGFARYADCSLPEEFIENMEHIRELEFYSLIGYRISLEPEFINQLPNLRRLHLVDTSIYSDIPRPSEDFQLNISENLDNRFLIKRWKEITSNPLRYKKIQTLRFFSKSGRSYADADQNILDLSLLSSGYIERLILDTVKTIRFEAVFSLLYLDVIPLIQVGENCIWGLEARMPLREIFSEPEQAEEKLLSLHQEIEQEGGVVIPIDKKGDYWVKAKSPVFAELPYLNIAEVYLQIENPNATSLSKYELEGLPMNIKRLSIASGKWDEELQAWSYEGHSASKLINFSGLKGFPELEVLELHNMQRLRQKIFKTYFSKLPKLREIHLIKCKISHKTFEKAMKEHLPRVRLIVRNR